MIDWVVKCQSHGSPLQYVSQNQLKCGSCEIDDEQYPYLDWVAKISRLAQDGAKYYKQCSQILGKTSWDQDTIQTIKMEKLKLIEQFKVLKSIIFIKLDKLQDNLTKQIDEQVQKYEDDMALFFKVQQEIQVCQAAQYLHNSNNIHLLLQQSSKSQVDDVFTLIEELQSINLQDKQMATKLKLAKKRISEQDIGLYQLKEPIESLLNRLIDQIQGNFIMSNKKLSSVPLPFQQISSQQQYRPLSPLNKENNYYSHNPTQASGPPAILTPLSSNRTMQKQYSIPTEKSQSKSPRRITPSPLKTRQEITISTMMATNGNKTLLLNPDKKGFNPLDMIIKPLKKYQIDFPVAAVEVVTESIFAMSSCVDPYLRIFDTVQKRIHTLQCHIYPITIIEKSFTINQQNGAKSGQGWQKPRFLITLSSDQLVVWVFECSQQGGAVQPVPQIQHKIKCQDNIRSLCYLQDGQTILQGDSLGGINLYNIIFQKNQVIERQHQKAILNMTYQQKQRKVIVFCEDQSVSIWKVSFKLSIIDTILNEVQPFFIDMGFLKTVNIVNNQDHLIIGNSEGQLKILNLLTQQIELETLPQSPSIVDMIIAEDINDENIICAVAICQNLRSLRIWKIQKSESQYIQTECKVDIAMTLGDNLQQSKLQFVQLINGSYYVLIANENGKELLVYEVTSKQ